MVVCGGWSGGIADVDGRRDGWDEGESGGAEFGGGVVRGDVGPEVVLSLVGFGGTTGGALACKEGFDGGGVGF